MQITKNTTIEELVEDVPGAVKYLMDAGIRCIRCGEPIWGTLEEAAKEKKFTDEEIEKFVTDLNNLDEKKEDKDSRSQKIIETKKYKT